ncbi:uncharacterized protein LOC110681607 [Chenopodium quinoa]|uniref:uncharacterized protein LOC110681606 n=1 Tax=Chenopodium quinoa TaxID=63459 RepID=UPI000B76C9CF|nr:uncharacterized protein LOC110681606 [Chenopodium quinoa]XP_021713452.1 uncharacterized protein LOC110681607 [Chenopodium quinoa]
MEEADVILGFRIKKGNGSISLAQSHYIKKVIKKFSGLDSSLMSTLMDLNVSLVPNGGGLVSQLDYARLVGCMMYAMTSTRPDIAFAVGKLCRRTCNPSMNHWQSLSRVLRYLRKTMDYGMVYKGVDPSNLEG